MSEPTVPQRVRAGKIAKAAQVYRDIFGGIKTSFALSVFTYVSDKPRNITLKSERAGAEYLGQGMILITPDKHLYEVIVLDKGIHPELRYLDE